MLSKDLPVGAHVAYNSGTASYKNMREAFVFAHRGKGNKTSYWGYRTGNNDTIGVAYQAYRGPRESGPAVWEFAWVPPRSIEMTWDEFAATVARAEANNKAIAKQRAESQASRKAQYARIPASVVTALGLSSYQIDHIVERGSYSNFNLSLDKIEAVIKAVQELER